MQAHKPKNKKASKFVHGLNKVMWAMGNNAFLCIIIFIVIDVLIAEFLFYHYVIGAQQATPQTSGSYTVFQEQTYNAVLKEWQTRNDMFTKAGTTTYSDPFKDAAIIPTQPTQTPAAAPNP